MKLSIVIPAYNEEKRIVPMLEAYTEYFYAKYDRDVEFVVIVNGSVDRTAEIVASFADRFPNFRYEDIKEGIGKGGAVMRGFELATGDFIGFADADGSTPPEAFEDLVQNIGDAQAIIASRWRKDSEISPRQPFMRLLASRCFNLLTRFGFGLRLTDTQCGAKLFAKAPLKAILPALGITRWAFDVDLLFQFRKRKYEIKEIPTTWKDVEGSKIDVVVDSLQMFIALLRLRLVYSPFKWLIPLYEKTIQPVLNPKGHAEDQLFRQSILLLAGTQVGNLCNILFQVVMVRMLTEIDFGVLYAMLGLFLILSTPLLALTRTLAHFTARFIQDQEPERIKGMVWAVARDIGLVAVVLLGTVLLFQHPVIAFFNLDHPAPLLLTALILVATLFNPVGHGPLTGAQAFKWIATYNVLWGLLRLGLAALLVMLGWGVLGALGGHLIALVACLFLVLYAQRSLFGPFPLRLDRPEGLYRHFFGYVLTFIAYALLMYADMIVVKHFFSPEEAGFYAKAAMVGRIILFLPQPIATVMFPKVTSAGGSSDETWRILVKALFLVSGIAVAAALFCAVKPGWVLILLSGETSVELETVIMVMVWGLCPLTVVFLIMNYELAQRRFGITWPLLVSAVLYILGLVRWHGSFVEIATVLVVAGNVALVLVLLELFAQRRRV